MQTGNTGEDSFGLAAAMDHVTSLDPPELVAFHQDRFTVDRLHWLPVLHRQSASDLVLHGHPAVLENMQCASVL